LDDGDHTYLYGPSLTPVAQVDGSGTVQYLHGDLLGSVRTITDNAGAVVGASTFDAFGSRIAHTGTSDSLFGFTGNWTDPDTHLVHLRARDYDPATGQFLTVDPAVDSTQQPYAYTGNSLVQRTDPSGLDWIQDAYDAAVDVAIGGAGALNCILEQAAAFTAGALDSLTFGVSSVVLGAVVPGYNDFVAGHEAAFTAGSITVTVIQIAIAMVTTAGAVIALIAVKLAAKAALKAEGKAAARAATTLEREGLLGVERGAANSGRTVAMGRNMPDRVIPYAQRNGYGHYHGTPKFVPRGVIERISPRALEKVDIWFNKRWIQGEMRNGSRIVDIGEPAGYRPSQFYSLEREQISRYGNYFQDFQP
jgi:RHS repeat-associated protein